MTVAAQEYVSLQEIEWAFVINAAIATIQNVASTTISSKKILVEKDKKQESLLLKKKPIGYFPKIVTVILAQRLKAHKMYCGN